MVALQTWTCKKGFTDVLAESTSPVPYTSYFSCKCGDGTNNWYSIILQYSLYCYWTSHIYLYFATNISNQLFCFLAVQTFARLGLFDTGMMEHVYMCISMCLKDYYFMQFGTYCTTLLLYEILQNKHAVLYYDSLVLWVNLGSHPCWFCIANCKDKAVINDCSISIQ